MAGRIKDRLDGSEADGKPNEFNESANGDDERRGSKPRVLNGRIVTVEVGAVPVIWKVHEDVLCDNSDFFKGALRGKFAEAADASINLPDDEPEVFEYFLCYAYSKALNQDGFDLPSITPPPEEEGSAASSISFKAADFSSSNPDPRFVSFDSTPRFGLYLDLYIFALKTLSEDLANHCINIINEYCQDYCRVPSPDWLVRVYTYTSDNDGMRRMLCHRFVQATVKGSSQEALSDAVRYVLQQSPELVVDLFNACRTNCLASNGSKVTYAGNALCALHQHKTTEKCKTATK